MTGKNYQIESATVSDKGLSDKRPQNEDSYLELNAQGLFAVADGVGGAQAGDVASQMAVEILGEAFINLPPNADVEEVLKLAIERANEAIYQMSHDLASLSTMATTIVAVHIADSIATIGHVGDSRLYRLDPNGNLHRETDDHSMVEEEVRAGRMTAAQAANHPSKNIISRALGAEETVEVDTKTIMIEPHTKFLVCSDGITRHIDDFQLRELLQFSDAPGNICQRMKDICYQRGAEDNLTAVIAEVTDQINETPPAAAPRIFAPPPDLPNDLEEPTLATARLPQIVEPNFVEEEIPTQPLVMPTADLTAREIEVEKPIPVLIPTPPLEIAAPPEIVEEIETPRVVAAKSGSGFFGKLLSALILLIVGGILGAGGYYFWTSNNQPPNVPQLAPQSTNIEESSFESLRRSVDSNPNNYIDKNATITQDVEGLYLLGRAYLLVGKFPEAKKYLEDAQNKLAQANAVNNKVLATDIALGLAVVEESAAQNKFQSQMKTENPAANSPTNVNG
ncbi:MAG: protein phosphatase 2C domain-containing protein, partial [Acidobacteriota bacterium]|nr:protein phosphatase 2C domain-containing protein [Acidobacteriota bacterium]